MGWIQYSSICYQVHVGSYIRVLSCQVMNANAFQGLDAGRGYPVAGAHGWGDWMPGSLLGQGWRGNGWRGGEIPSTYA
jgi:hypothetical protein